jgi:hypothetical protein
VKLVRLRVEPCGLRFCGEKRYSKIIKSDEIKGRMIIYYAVL